MVSPIGRQVVNIPAMYGLFERYCGPSLFVLTIGAQCLQITCWIHIFDVDDIGEHVQSAYPCNTCPSRRVITPKSYMA